MSLEIDIFWMERALALAQSAKQMGEVPVGALLVRHGELVGEGTNSPISSQDPTAHAEIMALRAAAKNVGNYRLLDTTLYVTLEPCLMCVGAMVHARIKYIKYGAPDPKTGAIKSVTQALDLPYLNHKIEYQGGILAEAGGALLKAFFKERRFKQCNKNSL